MIETVYKNQEKAPPELQLWLEQHKQELLKYPNHYLLITLPTGIMAAAKDQKELLEKLSDMSMDLDFFSAEQLLEPSFIVNTLIIDKKNWSIA